MKQGKERTFIQWCISLINFNCLFKTNAIPSHKFRWKLYYDKNNAKIKNFPGNSWLEYSLHSDRTQRRIGGCRKQSGCINQNRRRKQVERIARSLSLSTINYSSYSSIKNSMALSSNLHSTSSINKPSMLLSNLQSPPRSLLLASATLEKASEVFFRA